MRTNVLGQTGAFHHAKHGGNYFAFTWTPINFTALSTLSPSLGSTSASLMFATISSGLVSDVSTYGTDLGKLIREDFWLIVTIME